MAVIPTLETPRLILSAPTSTSFADSVAMWSDPEVVRHIGGVPFSEEETWGRLLRNVGHWELLGFGTWVVHDRAGAFVGEVGFFDLHRAIEPALVVPEAGWVLARAAHGQGYATEAVQAAIAWGERRFGARPLGCMIDVDNIASLRVAAKCGFREHARATYKRAPVILLRR